MVDYTNKYKLPDALTNAIIKTQLEYDNEGSDLSASSITLPPRIYWLEKRYGDEAVIDVRSLYRSFIGTIAHNACEEAAKGDDNLIIEIRYSKEVAGWKISAKIDRYDKTTKTLTDLKFSAVYALTSPPKFEYIAQLNTQAYLMREADISVDNLELCISGVDWYESKSIQKDYSNTPSKAVPIEMWSTEKTGDYIKERVALLQLHKETPDDKLPLCTPEDMWQDPTRYAVMKKNAKRATRVLDCEKEAVAMAKELGAIVQERVSAPRRCSSYCKIKDFCGQYSKSTTKRVTFTI